MFGFGKKKEPMTTKQLGEAFCGFVITKNFNKEGKFLYTEYWKEYFPAVSEGEFFREWMLYEAWMAMNTFSDYFKDNRLGSEAYQQFISHLKEIFVKDNLVSSMTEADNIFSSRHKAYEEEMQANREPNYIYWVSKKFCGFLGNDKDVQAVMIHSGTFVGIIDYNAKALLRVMEKAKLVK